jgi:5'-3' exonuclease
MSKLVLVDFSHLANACWYPALAAEDAGKAAMVEHLKTCQTCVPPGPPVERPAKCPEAPKQYDAKLVLHTNLDLKLETLKEAIGVLPNYFVFVRDSHAEAKYQMFPGYKGNRDRDRFDPRPLAEGYVRNSLASSARWVVSPKYEADDTVATLAIAESSAGDKDVVVVSGDKDLWQLLQYPRIRIFNPSQKVFVERQHIAKAFNGLNDPRFIALHKALWGDAGDNVPNAVPRMQKPLQPVIEASDGTLMDFLEKTDQFPLSPRCVQLLQENLRQVVINDKLVRLATGVPLVWE